MKGEDKKGELGGNILIYSERIFGFWTISFFLNLAMVCIVFFFTSSWDTWENIMGDLKNASSYVKFAALIIIALFLGFFAVTPIKNFVLHGIVGECMNLTYKEEEFEILGTMKKYLLAISIMEITLFIPLVLPPIILIFKFLYFLKFKKFRKIREGLNENHQTGVL